MMIGQHTAGINFQYMIQQEFKMKTELYLSEKELRNPYFLTGAGISLESGIPTFRGNDKDAVWSKIDVSTGTLSYFKENPVLSWERYLERFDKLSLALPSSSHKLIKKIEDERSGTVVVTQNVDGLHTLAGSKDVYEIHGSSRFFRCSKHKCSYGSPDGLIKSEDVSLSDFRLHKTVDTLPRCPACKSIIRPHVLWFDESYLSHNSFRFQEAIDRVEDATVIIALGTSLQVSIGSYIKEWSDYIGIRMICIDPFLSKTPMKGVELYNISSNDFLTKYF